MVVSVCQTTQQNISEDSQLNIKFVLVYNVNGDFTMTWKRRFMEFAKCYDVLLLEILKKGALRITLNLLKKCCY
jgi:hypothetical protein